MRKRDRQWAHRARLLLYEQIGGAFCRHCHTTEDLTFDCICPQSDGHAHRTNAADRMVYYRRQFREGNLQVLCRSCNARKGIKRNYRPIGMTLPPRRNCHLTPEP